MEYEETELRLGLPGGNGNGENGEVMTKNNNVSNGNKRGFSETVVDLKLELASKDSEAEEKEQTITKEKMVSVASAASNSDPAKPPAK